MEFRKRKVPTKNELVALVLPLKKKENKKIIKIMKFSKKDWISGIDIPFKKKENKIKIIKFSQEEWIVALTFF